MRNRLLDWSDKLLLSKRAIIETINDQLKNICQIEQTIPPSQPHQFPGESGCRPVHLLPAAQKAFSRAATSRSAGSLAYPELTLKQVESQEQLSTPRCFLW